MEYQNIRRGVFLSRENRFSATVEIDGKREAVHVKNTGRLGELLLPGAGVYVQESGNLGRKTRWDLISVEHGGGLVNIDSQAPNRVFGQWIRAGKFLPGANLIKPEYTLGSSRFDFYLEREEEKHLVEVKGVTLAEGDTALFPDAPTLRGERHVRELTELARRGYHAHVVFVIQRTGPVYFSPNRRTQPTFADALLQAREGGVEILALDCAVTECTLTIQKDIPVILPKEGKV